MIRSDMHFSQSKNASLLNSYVNKETTAREVVVAQLVERSLPIPEVRGSDPVIGKNLFI